MIIMFNHNQNCKRDNYNVQSQFRPLIQGPSLATAVPTGIFSGKRVQLAVSNGTEGGVSGIVEVWENKTWSRYVMVFCLLSNCPSPPLSLSH